MTLVEKTLRVPNKSRIHEHSDQTRLPNTKKQEALTGSTLVLVEGRLDVRALNDVLLALEGAKERVGENSSG